MLPAWMIFVSVVCSLRRWSNSAFQLPSRVIRTPNYRSPVSISNLLCNHDWNAVSDERDRCKEIEKCCNQQVEGRVQNSADLYSSAALEFKLGSTRTLNHQKRRRRKLLYLYNMMPNANPDLFDRYLLKLITNYYQSLLLQPPTKTHKSKSQRSHHTSLITTRTVE